MTEAWRGGIPPQGLSAPPRPPDLEAVTGRRFRRRDTAIAALFLLPALVVLGAVVVYPIFFTIGRSLFDRLGDTFVGLDNYRVMFERPQTLLAIRNMVIWVVVAPFVATTLGLIFAVLTERIRLATAFKTVIFMPMAISFLASGVIFRLVYEEDPSRGLANAALTGIAGLWDDSGAYEGARLADPEGFVALDPGFRSRDPVPVGDAVPVGLVGIRPDRLPGDPEPAAVPADVPPDAIAGAVWLDFSPGGEQGVVDPGEVGLPGVAVAAVTPDGDVAARSEAEPDGSFLLAGLEPGGSYHLVLEGSNFTEPWRGVLWLGTQNVTPVGPAMVTVSVIIAFLWIWAGFAMTVIAAGLAAIPTEVQEAARVDGGTEWQVFRKVTIPLLWPVLTVVLVTLMINVLKIFDLVLVIPPGSSQGAATVPALEMWRVSFGGARDQGLGSALGVLLFALVLPFMVINIRRFRRSE